MTTPSEPTTPTPEQRAATINNLCPEGWSVRPSGSSLAIVNPGAPDAPPAVIHADDASIVATIWTWHARALETSRTEALNTRREAVRCGEEVVAARLKLAEIVAEFSAGMFTPADFIKRAVDVDEALREIRERRRLDREERDAREAALVKAAKREDVPAELAPFAALSLADIGHAAWLCGYHPGDDPRKVFERAARRASEWQAIEALLADDLKKAREVDPACTVESLVERLKRGDAYAFALKIEELVGKIDLMQAKADEIGSRTESAEHALTCLGWPGDGGPLAWAHAQREKHAEPTLAQMVQLEADVATLVTENNRLVTARDTFHAEAQRHQQEVIVWRERFEKHEADIRQIAAAYFDAGLGGTPATPGKVAERLNELGQARRAMATREARLAAATAERDEFRTTLRAIGLRDAESLEDFQARIVSEGQEAMWWRDNRADLEALRELQKARNDLRVYEMDARSLPMLASQAAALFDHLPESLEARSYDADRGASIAVRITRDPKRVETAPVSFDLRSADPEKLAAVLSTPIEPRIVGNPIPRRSPADQIAEQVKATLANKTATKPERNVMDEVRGLGEATERFDRAAMGETAKRYETVLSADAVPADLEARQNDRLHIPGDNPGRVRSMNGLDEHFALPGIGFVAARWAGTLARGEHWRIVADVLPDYAIRGIADSWGWSRKLAGETFTSAGYKTPAEAFKAARKHREELKAAMDRGPVRTPAAVIAAMFPLARRLVIIDQGALVDGDDPRAHIVNVDIPSSREQEQAAVVCSVMPTGEINVLKNRQDGKVGLITPVEGATFASMTWTGSAWVPAKPPVPVAVGETEAGPFTVTTTMDGTEYAATFQTGPIAAARIAMGVDGPARAPVWTGITWMSGKGRAKSLTVPGLHVRADLGSNALRSAKMESLSQKAIKVLQRRDRLYAFHLPGGVKRYGYVDTWSHLRAGEQFAISIRPPEVKATAPSKPARQGISWRRPGHDVDSFHEAAIRPTYDNVGNHVIEVHDQLPDDLHAEIKQVMRDRPTITATTVNGAKITGPVIGWEQELNSGGVVWRLTVPMRNPTPRT